MKKKIVEQHIRKSTEYLRKTTFDIIPTDCDKTELARFIPRWLPDAIAYNCKLCNSDFGIFLRKHHCRFCGDVFCNNCCYRYESFLPFYKRQVRICEHCYVKNRLNSIIL